MGEELRLTTFTIGFAYRLGAAWSRSGDLLMMPRIGQEQVGAESPRRPAAR